MNLIDYYCQDCDWERKHSCAKEGDLTYPLQCAWCAAREYRLHDNAPPYYDEPDFEKSVDALYAALLADAERAVEVFACLPVA